jgi:hypothetical protein
VQVVSTNEARCICPERAFSPTLPHEKSTAIVATDQVERLNQEQVDQCQAQHRFRKKNNTVCNTTDALTHNIIIFVCFAFSYSSACFHDYIATTTHA